MQLRHLDGEHHKAGAGGLGGRPRTGPGHGGLLLYIHPGPPKQDDGGQSAGDLHYLGDSHQEDFLHQHRAVPRVRPDVQTDVTGVQGEKGQPGDQQYRSDRLQQLWQVPGSYRGSLVAICLIIIVILSQQDIAGLQKI